MLTELFFLSSNNLLQIINLLFPFELMLFEYIVMRFSPRRNRFACRMAIVCLCLTLYILFVPRIVYVWWAGGLYFAFMFLCSAGVMAFLFQNNLKHIIYYCSAGYCMQNIVANASWLILFMISHIDNTLYISVAILGRFILYVVVAAIFYAIYMKRLREGIKIKFSRRQVVTVVLLTITIADVLNVVSAAGNVYVVENLTFADIATLNDVTIRMVLIFCNLLVIFLQFGIFMRNQLETELQKIYNILHRDAELFKYSKDNIDMLNAMAHDLKYVINNCDIKKDANMAAIDRHIREYDAIISTGNQALDVILTEKNFVAVKYGIVFGVIADGRLLDFMADTDIYTMFGNLLDNAIEGVLAVDDDNKRCITLSVTEKDGRVEIYEENYYVGKLQFENEFLVSSKRNKESHGYGVRSIDYIVKKYGGTLSLRINEYIFSIAIDIPKQ